MTSDIKLVLNSSAEHLYPSGSEVKNEWSSISTPHPLCFTVCTSTIVTKSFPHYTLDYYTGIPQNYTVYTSCLMYHF